MGRKGQPLTLDSQARTHACMREGGMEGGREAGMEVDRQEQCFRGIQSLGLFKVAEIFVQNPPQFLWEAIILVS